MFKHLLVPLDGSRLAESVLPAAAYLADSLKAWVTLVHVIEHDAPQHIHGDMHLSQPDQARAYLEGIIGRTFPPAMRVEQHVHTSATKDVAESIVQHVDELGSDLILMCTHGKSGLKDLLFGSIAQHVINLGTTPLLAIRPDSPDMSEAFRLNRFLVALDGDAGHEQGLAVAAALAGICKASLHLLFVVPTRGTVPGNWAVTSRLLPGATSHLLDMAGEEAEGYLKEQTERLADSGLEITSEVLRGDPATSITDSARDSKSDLIVLGTHGRVGMDAFWAGSITPKVFMKCHLPLLLVPARE